MYINKKDRWRKEQQGKQLNKELRHTLFYLISTDFQKLWLFSKDVGINLLKPNDIYIYICRTAALTSRRYILNIYSTNMHTEYFKHAA